MNIRKLLKSIPFITAFLCGTIPLSAQSVSSDQWAATDALGRVLSTYSDMEKKKQDKFIAMFYWTWHQQDDVTTYQVKNITEIIRKYPEACE